MAAPPPRSRGRAIFQIDGVALPSLGGGRGIAYMGVVNIVVPAHDQPLPLRTLNAVLADCDHDDVVEHALAHPDVPRLLLATELDGRSPLTAARGRHVPRLLALGAVPAPADLAALEPGADLDACLRARQWTAVELTEAAEAALAPATRDALLRAGAGASVDFLAERLRRGMPLAPHLSSAPAGGGGGLLARLGVARRAAPQAEPTALRAGGLSALLRLALRLDQAADVEALLGAVRAPFAPDVVALAVGSAAFGPVLRAAQREGVALGAALAAAERAGDEAAAAALRAASPGLEPAAPAAAPAAAEEPEPAPDAPPGSAARLVWLARQRDGAGVVAELARADAASVNARVAGGQTPFEACLANYLSDETWAPLLAAGARPTARVALAAAKFGGEAWRSLTREQACARDPGTLATALELAVADVVANPGRQVSLKTLDWLLAADGCGALPARGLLRLLADPRAVPVVRGCLCAGATVDWAGFGGFAVVFHPRVLRRVERAVRGTAAAAGLREFQRRALQPWVVSGGGPFAGLPGRVRREVVEFAVGRRSGGDGPAAGRRA